MTKILMTKIQCRRICKSSCQTNKESSEDFATEPLRGEIEMPNSMFLGSGAISQMSQFAAANSASVGEPIPSHYKMCPSVVVGRFRNRSGRLLERLTVAAESEKRRIAESLPYFVTNPSNPSCGTDMITSYKVICVNCFCMYTDVYCIFL